MSRFSENRLADAIMERMDETTIGRRRTAKYTVIATFFGGLIGNFFFSKIEVAAFLWTVTLYALADLLLSTGKLTTIGRSIRIPLNVVIVCILWFLSYPTVHEQYRVQHAALTSGVLRARSDGKDHSGNPIVVEFGEHGTTIGFPSGKNAGGFGFPKDNFLLSRVGNQILLSTTVRDRQDNLIVEIRDNHWRVSKSETNCWDKNYTDDSLEVKDGRGRVVLQVRILPDRIQVQGEWPTTDNTVTQIGKYSKENGITPRFKYPSSEYWGEIDPDSGYDKE